MSLLVTTTLTQAQADQHGAGRPRFADAPNGNYFARLKQIGCKVAEKKTFGFLFAFFPSTCHPCCCWDRCRVQMHSCKCMPFYSVHITGSPTRPIRTLSAWQNMGFLGNQVCRLVASCLLSCLSCLVLFVQVVAFDKYNPFIFLNHEASALLPCISHAFPHFSSRTPFSSILTPRVFDVMGMTPPSVHDASNPSSVVIPTAGNGFFFIHLHQRPFSGAMFHQRRSVSPPPSSN